MNRIESAVRYYRMTVSEELVAQSRIDRYFEFPVKPLVVWLEQYVLPAVEELWQRPQYQELAAWPQRHLGPGAETAERQLVEAVDHAIVMTARSLRDLAEPKLIAKNLKEQNPPKPTIVGETLVIGDEETEVAERIVEPFDNLALLQTQVTQIANRSWTDLVCVHDYVGPVGGMMRSETPRMEEGNYVTDGEFVTSLNVDLLPVGDFVTRCLMKRIDAYSAILQDFRSRVYQAQRATNRPYENKVTTEESAWQELCEKSKQLRSRCLTENFQRRDAAIVLAQVYLSFHPAPQVSWLGLSNEIVEQFTGILRHQVESMRDLETVERIATALGEIQRLYQELPEGLSAFDEAVAQRGLVLRQEPRTAFWNGKIIDVDWIRSDSPWEMLWELASKALYGSAVKECDLYGDVAGGSTMANRWRRLKKLLPPDLAKKVEPGLERSSYQLKLDRGLVNLFNS